jgi:hypothetical protein
MYITVYIYKGGNTMSKKSLLSPMTAVQMAWALTGLFSKEKPTQDFISSVEKKQKEKNSEKKDKKNANPESSTPEKAPSQFPTFLIDKALEDVRCRAKGDLENKYVDRVIAAMNSSLRSIHVVYKGRNLNFDENEELRVTYLKSMREGIDYWHKLKNSIKFIPATSIGAAGGVTLSEIISNESEVTELYQWLFIAAFTALGFFVGWINVWWRGRKMWERYVKQDYERNLYFKNYLERVTKILTSLYNDVCQIYKETFGKSHPEVPERECFIEDMLKGMQPKLCDYVHKHVRENKITAELWPMCETGEMKIIKRHCKLWKREQRKSIFYSEYEKIRNRIFNLLYIKKEKIICDDSNQLKG